MEAKTSEDKKIKQVAEDYIKNGYKVIIEPFGTDIPIFIRNYRPDLIATNDKEKVIIEIKSRSDFKDIEQLRDIADIINKQDEWRFELIVINSKEVDLSESNSLNINLNIREVENGINDVKKLFDLGLYSAAFVLSWANLESIARHLLLEDRKDMTNKITLVLIKTLFSFGYLNRSDYESLGRLFIVRNQLIHGFRPNDLNRNTTEKLILITDKLLNEKDKLFSIK